MDMAGRRTRLGDEHAHEWSFVFERVAVSIFRFRVGVRSLAMVHIGTNSTVLLLLI